MKKFLVAILILALMMPVALAENNDALDKYMQEACDAVVDEAVINAAHYVVYDEYSVILVFLQSDTLTELLADESFSGWDIAEEIVASYYPLFRLAADMGDSKYEVSINLTDNALLEDADEREILWVYGLNGKGETVTQFHIRDGLGDLPEGVSFLYTIK